jgi:hypothetical protein
MHKLTGIQLLRLSIKTTPVAIAAYRETSSGNPPRISLKVCGIVLPHR